MSSPSLDVAALGNPKLLAAHRRFLDVLVMQRHRDAGGAYRTVYPKCSTAASQVQASRILKRPEARAYLAEREAEAADLAGLTAARLREEMAAIAFSSIEDYVIDENGHVALAAGAAPVAMRAVQLIKRKRREISLGENGTIVEYETELRLWDKNTALTLAAKHRGMVGADAASVNVNVNASASAGAAVDLSRLSDEELEAYEQLLAKIEGAPDPATALNPTSS